MNTQVLETELYRLHLIRQIVHKTKTVFENHGVYNKVRNGKTSSIVAQILMNQLGGMLGEYVSEDVVFPTNWLRDKEIMEELELSCRGKHVEVYRDLKFSEWFREAALEVSGMKYEGLRVGKKEDDTFVYMKTNGKYNQDIKLALDLYEKLQTDLKRNKYYGDYDVIIYTVVLRYIYILNSGNDQLGIPYYGDIAQKFDIKGELFASPLNHTLDMFCSLFPDIDSYFGSVGSVFKFLPTIKEGLYFGNPPFHNPIMAKFSQGVVDLLEKQPVTIVVVIPVWDYKGLIQMGYERTAEKYKDVDYKALQVLENSSFMKSKILTLKNKHPYFDHFGRMFIDASATYTIIMSSKNDDHSQLYCYLSNVTDMNSLILDKERHYRYVKNHVDRGNPLPSLWYKSEEFLERNPLFKKIQTKNKFGKRNESQHDKYRYFDY